MAAAQLTAGGRVLAAAPLQRPPALCAPAPCSSSSGRSGAAATWRAAPCCSSSGRSGAAATWRTVPAPPPSLAAAAPPQRPQRRRRPAVAAAAGAAPDGAAAPKWNPQNVADPVVVPSPGLSPRQAVEAQLAAAAANDAPWPNHGVQTLYEWCIDAGSMERSRYFGVEKDIYHQDHFAGAATTKLRGLIGNRGHEIVSEESPSAGVVVIKAAVVGPQGGEPAVFAFVMLQQEVGRRKGCWMTKQLVCLPPPPAAS